MMTIYFEALVQLAGSILLQLTLWRLLQFYLGHVPRQILLLFTLFWGVPLAHYAMDPSPDRLTLALALGCSYIMTFPALAAQSPTLLIVNILDQRGKLKPAELERELNAQTDLVEDRLTDLRSDGLAIVRDGRLEPTWIGRTLARTFWLYRRVLGLPMGEG